MDGTNLIAPEHTCKPELLATVGFSLRMEALNDVKLEMCPKINHSCCSVQDQHKMYNKWVIQEEHELLKERFAWYLQIYGDLYKIA